MAEGSIIIAVQQYLKELVRIGVPVKQGIIFGSCARNNAYKWSDIDVLVISDKYD